MLAMNGLTGAPAAYDPRGVLAESEREGWYLGLVASPWPGPWPKLNGDLFVVAPDGWQAGLVWETTGPEILPISGADESRWGVFQVRFPIPVMSMHDLTRNFHELLPLLKERHALAKTNRTGNEHI